MNTCDSCGRMTSNYPNRSGDYLCTDCGGNIKKSNILKSKPFGYMGGKK